MYKQFLDNLNKIKADLAITMLLDDIIGKF